MTGERVAPAVAELVDEFGRTIDIAVQDQQLGTGHAGLCGLSALPDDFTGIVVVTYGDVPLLDADTLADLIATQHAEPAAATVLTTALPDPTGYGRILRTQDSEVIGDRRAGRRHARRSRPSARSTPVSTPSTSRPCARR